MFISLIQVVTIISEMCTTEKDFASPCYGWHLACWERSSWISWLWTSLTKTDRLLCFVTFWVCTPYLQTSWSRVLLEMLTGFQLVKKFTAFYGTQNFITTFTSACHLSLSWASWIQSTPSHPTSWRFILILSSHLCQVLYPSGFPTKTLYIPLLSPIRTTCPVELILLNFITQTILGEEYKSLSFSLCSFLHSPVTLSLLGPNNLFKTYSLIPSAYIPPSMWATKFHTHIKQQATLYFSTF